MAKKKNNNGGGGDLFSAVDKTVVPAAAVVKSAAQAADAAMRVYSVRQLNALVKVAIERQVPGFLAVAGELSNFKVHSSGHCYFCLKDDESEIACVMWNSSFRKLKFKPKDGMAVVMRGKVDVYLPGGKYQFYAETMEPEGKGALQLAFEQMVQRLEAAGLFEQSHKKKLPAFPMRIGVVTSEDGAALHDIADSIFNRWPAVRLFLYPVAVQGEGAAGSIAAALRDINKRNAVLKLDLLIVGRGGGSIEDLWAFNEEVVARAIYDSKIPIISAVGHEVDTTISDLVADARAATPTKAAVIAVPDAREVLDKLEVVRRRLVGDLHNRLDLANGKLAAVLAAAVFRSPLGPVLAAVQELDEVFDRLKAVVRGRIADGRTQAAAFYEKLVQIEPHRLLGAKTVELAGLENKIKGLMSARLNLAGQRVDSVVVRVDSAANRVVGRAQLTLTAVENRLGALDPRSVLGRGYSITRKKESGAVVAGADGVNVGDVLITEFSGRNFVESTVSSKQNS